MTKKIRVENADTANFKVIAEIWDKGFDGKPDTLAETREIHSPAALEEIYITSSRYVVIKEIE